MPPYKCAFPVYYSLVFKLSSWLGRTLSHYGESECFFACTGKTAWKQHTELATNGRLSAQR